ncbi:DUF6968 family protein [Tunturibacter empetritectus]|uniref:DUF6968 domain-containing protein n=1 Tax=Tunturiibacter empetritectus TaxID=3069691 RepID=A0A7W8IFS4_9BACT|nr:hypothetical protein [Edaphobacter lichenicola]
MKSEPIGLRTFTCLANETTHEVLTVLYAPIEADGAYGCRFTVEGPTINLVEDITIFGQDGFQAIQLALFILRSTLITTSETSNWQWLGQDELGLPTVAT